MLFWNDKLPNGRTYIESSRVLLSGNNLRSVEYSSKSDKLFCDTQTNVRRPSAAPFPANGGQIVTWEEKISGKWKIGGSFIRDEVFQFTVQDQMKPLQLTNGKTGKVLLIWQERVNAKQNNLFARHIQPVSHRCAVKCQANEICLRDDHCVKRYKGECFVFQDLHINKEVQVQYCFEDNLSLVYTSGSEQAIGDYFFLFRIYRVSQKSVRL